MRLLLARILLSAGAAVVLVGAGVCVAALAVHADAAGRWSL